MRPKQPIRHPGHFQAGSWEFRFVVEEQNGSAVLASLQLAPLGSEFKVSLPTRSVPHGGITQATLVGFKIEEQIRNLLAVQAFSLGSPRTPPVLRIAKATPGRPAHPDWTYAMLAVEYEELGRRGSRTPARDMAPAYHKSPAQMTDLIRKARLYGFLTKATPGKAGGRATAKALRVLEEHGVDLARLRKQKATTKTKKTTRKGKR